MKKILFIPLFISTIFIGCSNSDSEPENCLDYKHAFITNIENENLNVRKNEDLAINISFGIDNSCGDFYEFDVVRNDKIFDIKVKTKYEGCVCNQSAGILNEVYYFRTAEEGVYTLKFYVSATEFVVKTVLVG